MSAPEKRVFKDHFSGCASGYADYRPRYPPEFAQYLARIAPRREVAWDCGCGSGQLSEDLARHFGRVVATDASTQQIARATPNARIEYRCAPAEDCGLPDASADLVVAAQAAHWFDLPAWYAEVRRVARSVGKERAVVAVAGYGNPELEGAPGDLLVHFYDDVVGEYWPPERRILESEYRDVPFPFAELDVPHLEMSVRWTLDELAGYVGTWSAVQALARAKGLAAFHEFRAQLALVWGPSDAARTVRWPFALRAGRV